MGKPIQLAHFVRNNHEQVVSKETLADLIRPEDAPYLLICADQRFVGKWNLMLLNRLYGEAPLEGLTWKGRLAAVLFPGQVTELGEVLHKVLGAPRDWLTMSPGERQKFISFEYAEGCLECGSLLPVKSLECVCVKCRTSRSIRIARSNGNIRRVRELHAFGSHTDAEWQAILERYGRRCLRCGTSQRVTKDHIVPLCRGGSNEASNLQPLCNRCNSWKWNRTIDFRDNRIEESAEIHALARVPDPNPSGERAGGRLDG